VWWDKKITAWLNKVTRKELQAEIKRGLKVRPTKK